jgi:hypothetical protein
MSLSCYMRRIFFYLTKASTKAKRYLRKAKKARRKNSLLNLSLEGGQNLPTAYG